MGFLGILLLVVFVIVAILLVLLVVIQDEGGDSLGGIFAGSGDTAFGARASNVVVRVTYILGGLFFVLAFALAVVSRSGSANLEAKALEAAGTQAVEWWNETPSAGVPELNLEAAPADTTPLEAPTAGSGQ